MKILEEEKNHVQDLQEILDVILSTLKLFDDTFSNI